MLQVRVSVCPEERSFLYASKTIASLRGFWSVVDNTVSSMHKKDAPAFLLCCEVSHGPKSSSQQPAQAPWSLLGQAQGTKVSQYASRLVWNQVLIHLCKGKERQKAVPNVCSGPAPGGVLHGRFTAVTTDTGQVTALLWHSLCPLQGSVRRNTSSFGSLTLKEKGQTESDLMTLPKEKVLVVLRI